MGFVKGLVRSAPSPLAPLALVQMGLLAKERRGGVRWAQGEWGPPSALALLWSINQEREDGSCPAQTPPLSSDDFQAGPPFPTARAESHLPGG